MEFYKKLDYFNKNLSNLMFDHSKKAMNKMSDLIRQNKKLIKDKLDVYQLYLLDQGKGCSFKLVDKKSKTKSHLILDRVD